jgi:hypothetical protein
LNASATSPDGTKSSADGAMSSADEGIQSADDAISRRHARNFINMFENSFATAADA